MTLAKLVRSIFAVVAVAAWLPAQECVLPGLRAAHARTVPGSDAWFATGFEVVEAELMIDLRLAQATATALHEAAESSSRPGAAPAAAAMVALACARLEGPQAAQVWADRADAIPSNTSPLLLVYFHLAMARLLCAQGNHAMELEHSIPGQGCADQLGDYPLRIRAAMTTMQATPQRSLVNYRRLMQEALCSEQAAAVEPFRLWLAIEELQQRLGEDRLVEAEQLVDEIERMAARDGNRRAEGLAASFRGNLQRLDGDLDATLVSLGRAREAFERLGDVKEVAGCIDMMAVIETQRGNYAIANELLDEADDCVSGRGLVSMEEELLKTRFQVAVRQHDGDAAAALAAEIDRRQELQRADNQRLVEVKARLAKAELERAAAEARLEAEQREATQRTIENRVWAGAGVALLLALFATLQWGSRHRLQVANRALRQQVRAVERAKAEQAKLQQRMRELERAESLGTLAAGVAHDFNNLLTSILGNAELLQLEQGSSGGAVLTAAIRAAGQQAARLCRQLQVYAGGAPIERTPCDVVAVARATLDVLRSATEGRVAIELDAAAAHIGALVDRGQIEQVLLNLVVNARDANARRVTIGIGRAEQAAGIAGAAAVLTVTDDGDGMTSEVLRRVFDPFFTTRFPGRGLGLAVVYGAVRRHGGTITVHSEPGRGARFTIHLPLAEVEPAAQEPMVVLPAVPPQPTFASMWVIDDEPAVRDMLVRMLRTLGHEATATGDGEAFLHAVSRLPAQQPVLAFVDLTMPGMEGPEVVRCLRELRDDARVVLMTGHSLDQLEQVAAELQPSATLSKPFHVGDVQRIVVDLAAPSATAAVPAAAV